MAELLDAAQTGSRLTALVALRDSLARDLDGCESLRDKASLSQRFMDTLSEIEVLEKAQAKPEEASPLAQVLALVGDSKPSRRSTRS